MSTLLVRNAVVLVTMDGAGASSSERSFHFAVARLNAKHGYGDHRRR